MTDPTDLGEIIVTGQRRQFGALHFPTNDNNWFPEEPDGGGGGMEIQLNPCAHPATRVIWNADAAAAAAVDAFVAKSHAVGDGGSLSNREFGANLVRDASGGVSVTSVDAGDPIQNGVVPSVTITGAATYLNWMGDIHNHPSGIGMPSAAEWAAFTARIDAIVAAYPERSIDMAYAAAYIVVGTPPNHQIFAFTRNSDPNQPGEEVNPDAQPC